MRATATVATTEPEALALRMRKHFAHKVEVTTAGRTSRIRIAAGEFELEPHEAALEIRAQAEDEAGLERVREVVASHLVRFARGEKLEIEWTSPRALEERALAWISRHRNARHLVRTRDWARHLLPDAGEALVLAALTHDVERDFPGEASLESQIAAWDDEAARASHCERSARIVGEWLRYAGAEEDLVRRVEDLVRLHESGGSDEADVLQAADSLSFLETNPAARWVSDGRSSPETARKKLRQMYDRIRPEAARRVAKPLYERAVAEVDGGAPASLSGRVG